MILFTLSEQYISGINGWGAMLLYGLLAVLLLLYFLMGLTLTLKAVGDKRCFFFIPVACGFLGAGVLMKASLGTFSVIAPLNLSYDIHFNDFLIYHFFRHVLMILVFVLTLVAYRFRRQGLLARNGPGLVAGVACGLVIVILTLAWLFSSHYPEIRLLFSSAETDALTPSWRYIANHAMVIIWLGLLLVMVLVTRATRLFWMVLVFYGLCSAGSLVYLWSEKVVTQYIWYQVYLFEAVSCMICLVFLFFNAYNVYALSHSRYHEARQDALRDYLTQIPNRRYFFEKLAGCLARTSARDPVTLIVCDIDFFKRINDRYGHHQGDIVLQYIAWVLQESVRKNDVVARIGGEEFALLLPGVSQEQARQVASRIQARLAQEVQTLSRHLLPEPVTLSMGLYTSGDVAINETECLRRADSALYEAKNSGRNCIRIWSDTRC
ncbi:sensor domain-containing diguanylate cyclase [Enterobacter sichuanensis]